MEADLAFLREQGSIVVKPALGEQGRGIVRQWSTILDQALAAAR